MRTADRQNKSGYVSLEKRYGIAIVRIDGPGKENVLGEAIRQPFEETVQSIVNDKTLIAVVIISAKPESFMAGADLELLEKTDGTKLVELSRDCQKAFQRIEDVDIPVVAAILGTCMGAGLELVLACSYRICIDTERTVFSLPEVRLGLLPACGGTQRLPKKIKIPVALDMLLTGRNVSAARAYQIGLVEEIIDPVLNDDGTTDYETSLRKLEDAAVVTAFRLSTNLIDPDSWYSVWRKCVNYFYSTSLVWNRLIKSSVTLKLQNSVMANVSAPYAILRCLEVSLFKDSSEGYEMESKEFGHLKETMDSKALIGLFHGITKCKKQRYGEAPHVRCLAIVGASEAALACACTVSSGDLNVCVVEPDQKLRIKANAYVKQYFENAIAKEKLRETSVKIKMQNLQFFESYNVLATADAVLITTTTDSSNKHFQGLLEKVEEIVFREIPILLHLFGNSLEELVSTAKYPDRIIGICYGVPYGLSKYGELVKHNGTNDNTVATAASILKKQNLFVILTTDTSLSPGYYLVYCVIAMLSIICKELMEGRINSAFEMDQFSKKAGFAGGFAEMCDLIGLNVIWNSAHRYQHLFCQNDLEFIHKMVQNGREGKACNKGFHIYSNGKTVKGVVDEDFLKFARYVQEKNQISHSNEWARSGSKKLLLNVTNIALSCFESKIINTPYEGDVGCVFGVGYPPAYGGPFRYVDQRICEIQQSVTGSQKFCPLLESRLLDPEKKFY